MIGAALLWGVGFTSYTAFMGHMGTDAAAANSIASVVRDLVCCMCNGLASGGGILVGNELGAGNLSTGREYGDRLMKLSFVCGLLSTAIMFAVTPLLIHRRSPSHFRLSLSNPYITNNLQTISCSSSFTSYPDIIFFF